MENGKARRQRQLSPERSERSFWTSPRRRSPRPTRLGSEGSTASPTERVVLDELEYLSPDDRDNEPFFQVIFERHEHERLICTISLPFGGSTKAFPDQARQTVVDPRRHRSAFDRHRR